MSAKTGLKILYATGKYSPLNPDDGSGSDYRLYHALLSQGAQLEISGPFSDKFSFLEKVYHKLHHIFSSRRPAKYSNGLLRQSAKILARTERVVKPEIIFSKNLAPLVHFKSTKPIVYMLDSTVKAFNQNWPTFSWLDYQRMFAWEKRVLKKCTLVITRSEWSRDSLVNDYRYPATQIRIVCNSASLPDELIPDKLAIPQPDFSVLRLLMVARVYQLKGIDIAMDITRQLNHAGIPTELRIVGMNGKEEPGIRFMGLFKKADPLQLKEYVDQYTWPHFLLHPARYDASPIVTAEAAAFGVPTLTNAVGGIATTVKDGVSGVVLPAHSPAEEYIRVIQYYLAHPGEFQALRRSTRSRFEQELNWQAAGKRIYGFLQELIDEPGEMLDSRSRI
jgi:glycosyltransferase involved in cell wall biosynthesis